MSPSIATEAWYPLSHLVPERHRGLRVMLRGPDWEAPGKVDRHPENRRWCWYQWREALGEFVLLVPWRRPNLAVPGTNPNARPSVLEPTAWAPIGAWPERLPEPVGRYRYVPQPPAEDPGTPPEESDGWPCPGMMLGKRVPPRSIEETEARILRGLRTMDTLVRVENISGGSVASDWLPELYWVGAKCPLYQDEEGRVVKLVDPNRIEDVRALWVSTLRDRTDWEFALDWWRRLDRRDREVIEMRAANPPYSFAGIGLRFRVTPNTARRWYVDAIARAHRLATGAAPC